MERSSLLNHISFLAVASADIDDKMFSFFIKKRKNKQTTRPNQIPNYIQRILIDDYYLEGTVQTKNIQLPWKSIVARFRIIISWVLEVNTIEISIIGNCFNELICHRAIRSCSIQSIFSSCFALALILRLLCIKQLSSFLFLSFSRTTQIIRLLRYSLYIYRYTSESNARNSKITTATVGATNGSTISAN